MSPVFYFKFFLYSLPSILHAVAPCSEVLSRNYESPVLVISFMVIKALLTK